jgi:glycosyltransferase involved in cell wall biosynthesis
MRFELGAEPQTLIASCLEVQEDPRTLAAISEDLAQKAPLWIAIANFQPRALELLEALPRPYNIYWRIEFMGARARPFLSSATVDPANFATRVMALGHHVIAYSFNDWNRVNTIERLPALRGAPFEVQPIAQKPVPRDAPELAFDKASLGVAARTPLIGAAGVHEPGKCIDEVAYWILEHASHAQPLAGLFFLITDDHPDDVIATWRSHVGSNEHAQLFVRRGDYKEWAAMQAFYQAVDVVVINSISDSWGRIVSEAAGAGTPVLIRQGDCGADKILPGAQLFDALHAMSAQDFMQRARLASAFAPSAKAYVDEHYGAAQVKTAWLSNLASRTPPDQRRHLERLIAEEALGDLPDMLDW